MTERPNPAPDEATRREELLRRFTLLAPDEAERELGLLPYYHVLENEITKPDQGIYVSRYFIRKWKPSLGSDAANIVQALRLLSNAEGWTFASYETIAQYAGLSERAVERWLSETAPKDRTPEWRQQWDLLHRYFVLSSKPRFRQRFSGTMSRVHRTTNSIRIAKDDPVHPDDRGALYVLAAQRILEEEAAAKAKQNNEIALNRPLGAKRPYEVVRDEMAPAPTVDNFSLNRPLGADVAPPVGRRGSYSESTNVTNVKGLLLQGTGTPTSGFSRDPRVTGLTREERARKEALVDELGQWLQQKAGSRAAFDEQHQSAGAHRRAVYFLGEHLVRQAMRDLEDRVADGREGRLDRVRNINATFWGIVKRKAEQEGIDLEPHPAP